MIKYPWHIIGRPSVDEIMKRLLHKIKTQLPSIPSKTLFCERIRDLRIAENRLSILTAPAGFGKTTAVLVSLKDHRERTWWYRLEQEDAFLGVFYQHLIDILFSGEPQILQDQKRLLRSLQNLDDEYAILNAQICQDLTYLYSQSTEPRFLVLDDFQFVAHAPEFQMILTYFVCNMPECVRLVIMSRSDPGILTVKLCMNYTCKQYGTEDLLFSPEEVHELIDHVYGFDFTPEQHELIIRRSHGWAAGIYILSQSIHNKQFLESRADLLSEVDSMFSLFFMEYLAGIEPENKARLMELAMLKDFSIDELNDLFCQEEPEEFLRWLATNQLCFQTTSHGQTRYYFHSLLSDELKRMFRRTRSEKELRAFFTGAAEYYLERDPVKAVELYLMAGEPQHAFSIGAAYARECFNGGVPERFVPVLSLFTPEQIAQNPYLLLMEGMRVLNIDRIRAQTAFMQALIAFRKLGDYRFLMNSFGMLMVVAYQHSSFADLQEAGKALPVLGIFLKGGSARTLLIISCFISLVGEDKLKRASRFLRHLDRKYIQEELWHFSYLMIRGIYHYRRGDLLSSRKNLETLLNHPVICSDDQWRIIGLVSCCNVPFLQADLELLQFFISEFTLLSERLNSDFALGYAQYLRGFLYQIQGKREEALAAFKSAKDAYCSYGSHVLQMEAECMSFIISDETSPEMIRRARIIVDNLRKENTSHGLEELATTTLGILLKRAGELDEAKIHLENSAAVCRKKGALQNLHALFLQLADLYFLRGEDEAAHEFYRKWMSLGKENGYIYSVPFTQQSLQRVLAHSGGLAEEDSYVREVVDFYNAARRGNRPEHPVKLTFFGSFCLQIGDRQLTEKDFRTRKVSGLLKYILVRGEPQSREKLAGIFWPESDRKSAGTSLRVALYELRKVLSAAGLGFDCEEALLKEGREGFALSDAHVVFTDTQQMEQLYEQWQTSNPEDPLQLLMRLCELYHGPFLEHGEYDDWVSIQREYYSGIYYEALHALGDLAVRSSHLPAAKYLLKGLELDPLDEVSYSHLIALYEATGQNDRAASLRRQFKKRYKQEMGFDADV